MKPSPLDSAPALHHDPRGGFRNPWFSPEPHGIAEVLKWMATRKRRPDGDEIEVTLGPDTTAAARSSAGLAMTWIGHSTFLIQSNGISVLTDPIWSDRASPVQFAGPRRHAPPGFPFNKLPAIDAIFQSHDHYDHLDNGTVRKLIKRHPHAKWVVPLRVGDFLRKRGAADVSEMDWWQEKELGITAARCTPAMHFSGRYPWNRNKSLWCGWVIEISGRRVFFAGDTGLHPEFGEISRRFGPFDAVILPIGAYEPRWFMKAVHMNPEDAVEAYADVVSVHGAERCTFVPAHWGTFRLTDEPLDEPPQRLRKAWMDAGFLESHLSILKHGETTSV